MDHGWFLACAGRWPLSSAWSVGAGSAASGRSGPGCGCVDWPDSSSSSSRSSSTLAFFSRSLQFRRLDSCLVRAVLLFAEQGTCGAERGEQLGRHGQGLLGGPFLMSIALDTVGRGPGSSRGGCSSWGSDSNGEKNNDLHGN